MGILDKLLGRSKKLGGDYQPLSKQTDFRTDEERDATRSRMEAEMQSGRDERAAQEKAKD